MWKLGAVFDASRGRLEGEGTHGAHSSSSVLVKIGCMERVGKRVRHCLPMYTSLLILGKYRYFHSSLEQTQKVAWVSYLHSTLLRVDHEFLRMSMK